MIIHTIIQIWYNVHILVKKNLPYRLRLLKCKFKYLFILFCDFILQSICIINHHIVSIEQYKSTLLLFTITVFQNYWNKAIAVKHAL